MTVGRLTILSNYRQLLSRQRIEVMHLEDVRLDMGQRKGLKLGGGTGKKDVSNTSSSNSTSMAEIVVDRGIIEYPRSKHPPLIFSVHQVTFDKVIQGKRISFHATIDNPLPPGRVQAGGQFDPWNVSDIGGTPLSGVYNFADARLSSLGGIAGTLSSQGSFARRANALQVQASTDTPNYEVKSAGHSLPLCTDFRAVVNCTNGDVRLQSIQGRFERTSFEVAGDVAGKKNARAKVASLQVADPRGRIEDWFRLFTSDQIPAMTGAISFQAQMTIPRGPKPFIRRVHLTGDFAITEVTFTKWKTRQGASSVFTRKGRKFPIRKKRSCQKLPVKFQGTSSCSMAWPIFPNCPLMNYRWAFRWRCWRHFDTLEGRIARLGGFQL